MIFAAPSKFAKKQIWFLTMMGLVMGLREFSMTMLNPFISIFGKMLIGSTPFLCGLALGIYGLTNAFFQLPYGIWSDRVGRKIVTLTGLAQLGAGLFLAFLAKSIFWLIVARALQGSGAVMAIAYAWIGDCIEDDKKGSAMGVAGIIVSLGAVLAFVLGPLLYKSISVRSMFLCCALLIVLAFIMILVFGKEAKVSKSVSIQRVPFWSQTKQLLTEKKLQLLCLAGFIINYLNAELFMIVPTRLEKMIGVENMWMVFLPAVLCGAIAMKWTTSLNDRGLYVPVAKMCFLTMLLAWILFIPGGFIGTAAGTILSLSGFMCLTAGIPSEMNKLVSREKRGTANGILQTMTFLGFFFGPTIAGVLLQLQIVPLLYGISIILASAGILSATSK